MTISEKLTTVSSALRNIKQAILDKGQTPSGDITTYATAIGSISTSGTIDTLTITPTTSQQTITATGGVDGYAPITVNAVTSAIDSDIKATNIKSGVNILGINGSVIELAGETKSVAITSTSGNTFTPSSGKNGITSITVTPTNQAKTITPTTSSQSITVPSGYSGFGTLTVEAVTSSIDSDIKATNIKSGVNILGVNGSVIELVGETRSVSLTSSSGNTFTPSSGKNGITSITVTPNNQARTVTPTTSQQSLTVGSGYSGNGTITVNAVTSSIDNNITAGNIKKDVTILGVTGTYEGSGGGTIDTLTITPTTSQQTITASGGVDGYSPITVNAVTSSIDANISAGNIKSGVSILGVTGTYEGSGGGGTGISREVSANGVYQMPSSNFTFSLPSNATDIGKAALAYAFSGCIKLTGVGLSSLTTLSSVQAMNYSFSNCTGLTSIDLSGLTTISGVQAMQYTFNNCSKLTSIDLSSLTTINGTNAMNTTFSGCSKLTSIDFPSLTTVTGAQAMASTFYGCTSLASVNLSGLTTVTGANAMSSTFYNCRNLTSIKFNNLQTIGSDTYAGNYGQFSNCFQNCNNLTSVTFPNLEKIYCTGGAPTSYGTFANNNKVQKMYFPKLDTITYGSGASTSNQNACKNVFYGCAALTELHFGSANQAAIEASPGYSTAWGRGAGNVTIYFDL